MPKKNLKLRRAFTPFGLSILAAALLLSAACKAPVNTDVVNFLKKDAAPDDPKTKDVNERSPAVPNVVINEVGHYVLTIGVVSGATGPVSKEIDLRLDFTQLGNSELKPGCDINKISGDEKSNDCDIRCSNRVHISTRVLRPSEEWITNIPIESDEAGCKCRRGECHGTATASFPVGNLNVEQIIRWDEFQDGNADRIVIEEHKFPK